MLTWVFVGAGRYRSRSTMNPAIRSFSVEDEDALEHALPFTTSLENAVNSNANYPLQSLSSVSEEEMASELKKLPPSVLLSWYLSYLFIRRELMHAGYELNGFKVLDAPLDTLHDLMEKDPEFDIKKYIF